MGLSHQVCHTLCGDQLPNEDLKPSKLIHPMETKHPSLKKQAYEV